MFCLITQISRIILYKTDIRCGITFKTVNRRRTNLLFSSQKCIAYLNKDSTILSYCYHHRQNSKVKKITMLEQIKFRIVDVINHSIDQLFEKKQQWVIILIKMCRNKYSRYFEVIDKHIEFS